MVLFTHKQYSLYTQFIDCIPTPKPHGNLVFQFFKACLPTHTWANMKVGGGKDYKVSQLATLYL
jgi:hypothetical protein